MKVVIAADSFKGSLSSKQAALAIEAGLRKICPKAIVEKIAIADGGEGTLEALKFKGAKKIFVNVQNPLGQRRRAAYLLLDKNTALVEIAQSSGLMLLDKSKLDIMRADTYGFGETICHALKKGAKNIYVALGGSATNDAGLGFLAALGYKFFDSKKIEIKNFGGANLSKIRRIDSSQKNPMLEGVKFKVLCDVKNVFCGKEGAAKIFAPQKGATKAQVDVLDKGLENFANVIKKETKIDLCKISGSGAAGGVGGAFAALLNAEILSGIDGVLDAVNFDEKICDADFVITAEGKVDAQSAFGKAVCGVSMRAKKPKVPVIVLAGGVESGAEKLYKKHVAAIFPIIQTPASLEDSMYEKTAKKNLEKTAENIFRLICATKRKQ